MQAVKGSRIVPASYINPSFPCLEFYGTSADDIIKRKPKIKIDRWNEMEKGNIYPLDFQALSEAFGVR